MSSNTLQSSLKLLLLNNYASLIVVTTVVYDYILTFSKEIEYVWCKPWTWVSTMFVIVRYVGLCVIMATDFGGSFITSPVEVNVSRFIDVRPQSGHFKGLVAYEVSGWGYVLFLSATDLMMILRVYAMWNQSRMILYILLFLFISQSVIAVVLDGIYSKVNAYVLVHILDFSFCNVTLNVPSLFQVYHAIPRLLLSAALLIFAVLQTLKQSYAIYRVTKRWQPNHYIQKLVRDGILYFFVNVAFQTIDLLSIVGAPTNNAFVFLYTVLYLAFYTLIPRFIIGIRELYDRDTRGRVHIDTGFGAQSRLNAGPDTTVSTMAFAEVDHGPASDLENGAPSSNTETNRRVHGPDLIEDFATGCSE